ncbi:MAG: hypothetical protein DRJ47_02240 [Thermoprotei archaeon]|nr:MAG: hypothetical protein DRJ47_02240 [Thermoprotei archaeon]
MKIRELNLDSRNFDVRVKVLEIGTERIVVTRRDGAEHRVAEALVGDETGVIKMTLWDENIDTLRDLEGSTVVIKNGYVNVFRNSLRLNIGRYGSVEKSAEDIEEVNRENNLSEQVIPDFRSSFRRTGFRRSPKRRFRRR